MDVVKALFWLRVTRMSKNGIALLCGVVIISRLDYLNKMKHLISDTTKFKELQHNPTKSREESLSTYLRKLRKDRMQLFIKSYRVDLLLAFYMDFLKFIRLVVLSALLFHRLTPITTIQSCFLPCFYTSANLDQPLHCQRLFQLRGLGQKVQA